MRRPLFMLMLRTMTLGAFLDGELVIKTVHSAVTGEPEAKQTWVFSRP